MPTYAVVNGENPGPLQHPAITLVNPNGSPYSPEADLAPWTVDIDGLQSIANTNWASPTAGAIFYGGYNLSSGAQNDEIAWDVVLSAGTWTIQLTHYTINSGGIYSVRIDGVEVGTIDGYVDPGGPNAVGLIPGVVIATTGKKRVSLKMATKHASSSNYYGLVQHVQFRRTT